MTVREAIGAAHPRHMGGGPMTLLDTGYVTYEFTITEDELRARLIAEAIQGLGLADAVASKQAPGLTTQVVRGDGRRGGYRVRISQDISKLARLPKGPTP